MQEGDPMTAMTKGLLADRDEVRILRIRHTARGS
jgi:hypothetical protein